MRITQMRLREYCTVVLVLMPLIGQYGLFSRTITLADVAIVPAVGILLLWCMFSRKLKVADTRYAFFALWFTVTSLLLSRLFTGIFASGAGMMILQHVVYFLAVLFIAPTCFDCEKGYRLYSSITIILCIIVFIQMILGLVTGEIGAWVIRSELFPHVYLSDEHLFDDSLTTIGDILRPSSLFSEPALFAQYVSPCLVLNLHRKNKTRKTYAVMVLVTIAVVLSQSANGVFYVLAAWIFFGLVKLKEKANGRRFFIKKRYALLLVVVLCSIPLLVQFAQDMLFNEDGFSIAVRLEELLDEAGQTSGSMRVIRGWLIFGGLSLPEKIVGIGTGNIVQYLNKHPDIVHMFTETYNGYMSGLPSIFVSSGLIGGTTYLFWWYRYFKSKRAVVKGLQIFLILYLIASNAFNTMQYILTMVMVISFEKQDTIKEHFE